MNTRRPLGIALTAALAGVLTIGSIVLATDAIGVSSRSIAGGRLDPAHVNTRNGDWRAHIKIQGPTDVAVAENRVAPGGTFGWHEHPGPSLIVVQQGTVTFYRADDPSCTPERHSAGEAFFDPGTDVHVGRNEGSVDLVVIVTRFLPAGASPRIDAPDPGICPG